MPFSVAALTIAFLTATLLGSVLGGVVYLRAQRRRHTAERAADRQRIVELARRIASVQEDERRRLARDVHDRVGASLATVNMDLSALSAALPAAGDSRVLLQTTRALVTDTVASLRELCADLRPAALEHSGLPLALENLALQYRRHLSADVQVMHERFSAHLSAESATALFRIAQEALTNCVKHAAARSVRIRLESHRGRCTLTIEDDGRGFALDALPENGHEPGQGLLNMRERAELAGGRLKLTTRPGHGTKVEVELASGAETG